MIGGYTGPGVKTVIPPRGEVKVSCRLVPNQTGEKIAKLVTKFVKSKNKDVVVHVKNRLDPYQGKTEGPLAEAVKRAMQFAFKREPVFVREGGSIGAVVTMENVLKCPVIFLGLSLPEHGYHAPNENFDWEQASGGMAAFTRYFGEVASLGKPSKIATPGKRPVVKAAAKKAPAKKAPAKKAKPVVKGKPAKKGTKKK
jgi:acetylornithine deacetylase/succinyl-diaminopimelate desuccinylase-like protein